MRWISLLIKPVPGVCIVCHTPPEKRTVIQKRTWGI